MTEAETKTKNLTVLKVQMVNVISNLQSKHELEELLPLLDLLKKLEKEINTLNAIDFQSWNTLDLQETKHKLGLNKINITQKICFLFNRIHVEGAYISSLNKSLAFGLKTELNNKGMEKLNKLRLCSIEKKKLFAASLKLLLRENLGINTTGMTLERITELLLENLDNGIINIFDYIYQGCTVCNNNHDNCQFESSQFCFCKLKSLNVKESQHYSGLVKFKFSSIMGMYEYSYIREVLQGNAPRLIADELWNLNNNKIKRRCAVVVKERTIYSDWTTGALSISGEFEVFNTKEIEVQIWQGPKDIGDLKHLVAIAVISLQALIERENPTEINISMEPEGCMIGEFKYSPLKKPNTDNGDLNKENWPVAADFLQKMKVKRRMNHLAKIAGHRLARHVEAHVPVSVWIDWFQNHIDRLAVPIDNIKNVTENKENKTLGFNKKILITPCKTPIMNKIANESYRQISESSMPKRIATPRFHQTNPRAICKFSHPQEIRLAGQETVPIVVEEPICSKAFVISTPYKDKISISKNRTPFFEAQKNIHGALVSPIHPPIHKPLKRSTTYYNEKTNIKINELLKTTKFMADCSLTRSNIDLTDVKEFDSIRLPRCDSLICSKTKLDESDTTTDMKQVTIFSKSILNSPFPLDSKLDFIPDSFSASRSVSRTGHSKYNNNFSQVSGKSNSTTNDKSIIMKSYKNDVIGVSFPKFVRTNSESQDTDDFDHVNGNGDTDSDTENDEDFGGGNIGELDHFNLLSVLGQGHFGKVLLAQMKETNNVCAIKCIQKVRASTETEYDSLFAERRILILIRRHKHPFLINLIGCFQSERHLFFALEYVPGGDFMGHVHKNPFSESDAKFYISCIVLALEFLHNKDIIYRDLKLDNVLMDRHGYAKLTDFGLSKQNMKWDSKTTTFCGTPEFLAPEIIEEKNYSRVIDWWALGVLLYEIVLGESPYPGDDDREIFSMILTITPNCKNLSPEATSLIKRLLKRIPERRLGYGSDGTEKVKEHVFFESIEWDKLYSRQIQPPFIPELTGVTDTQYFELEFTSQMVTIEHDDEEENQEFDDSLFNNFDTDLNWDF